MPKQTIKEILGSNGYKHAGGICMDNKQVDQAIDEIERLYREQVELDIDRTALDKFMETHTLPITTIKELEDTLQAICKNKEKVIKWKL